MTKNILPKSKPKLSQAEALQLIAPFALGAYPVKLLGIRGYYKQTMGNPVANDIGIYDDAIFLLSPDTFTSFNANTDPSVTRPGIAVMKAPQVVLYKIGPHGISRGKGYTALRQYGRVTVVREGVGERTDTAKAPFMLNIHKGGYNQTSSEGCQTIYPDQWQAFITLVQEQMKRHNQDIIPYVLIMAD